MRKLKDYDYLIGATINRFTVLDWYREDKKPFARVRCTCGTEKDLTMNSLLQGAIKSCGCRRKEFYATRGSPGCKTRAMVSFRSMHNNFWFSAHGISVDPSWNKFENFFKDMGERPDGCVLWRIDKKKDFSKENCIWRIRKSK